MSSFTLEMQRLTVISFLALLLFNAFGYYFLFNYGQKQALYLTQASASNSDFTIIKLPASLYLHLENTDFEYIDQVFEFQEKTYNKVKQRIVNDTLEIYCVRNADHERLKEQFNDYVVSQLNDNSTTSEKSPLKQLLKNFLKDYIPNDIYVLVVCSPNEVSESAKINIAASSALMSAYLSLHSPPPNAA